MRDRCALERSLSDLPVIFFFCVKKKQEIGWIYNDMDRSIVHSMRVFI
jgi:hypothetical protein